VKDGKSDTFESELLSVAIVKVTDYYNNIVMCE